MHSLIGGPLTETQKNMHMPKWTQDLMEHILKALIWKCQCRSSSFKCNVNIYFMVLCFYVILMSYSCLVGSFLNSTTATRPDLSATRQNNPSMLRLNRPGLRPKNTGKVGDQTRQVGDRTRLCQRPGSPTKSGRVAVVGFSLCTVTVSYTHLTLPTILRV